MDFLWAPHVAELLSVAAHDAVATEEISDGNPKAKIQIRKENNCAIGRRGKRFEAERACRPVKGVKADAGKSISPQSQIILFDRTINRGSNGFALLQAGFCAGNAAGARRSDDRCHRESNGLAAPFGARLPYRRGQNKAETKTGLREAG